MKIWRKWRNHPAWKYHVVTATSEAALASMVNDRLKQGWKLAGGVSVSHGYEVRPELFGRKLEMRFAQAMLSPAPSTTP